MENLNSLIRKPEFDQTYLINKYYAFPLPNQQEAKRKFRTVVREVESTALGLEGCGVDLAYFFSNYNQLEATTCQPIKGLSLMVFPLRGDTVKYTLTMTAQTLEKEPIVVYTRTFANDKELNKIDTVVLFQEDPMANPDYVAGFKNPRFKGLLPGYELIVPEKPIYPGLEVKFSTFSRGPY